MKWSKLRQRIKERMADSVRERIQLGSTVYGRSFGAMSRGWITVDGLQILNMPSITFEFECRGRVDEQTSYEEARRELHNENLFSRWDWHRALREYLNLSIDDILVSQNPLIRAIGMLDARLGKRRLRKIDVSSEHELVQRLYYVRCDSENLTSLIKLSKGVDLTSELSQPWVRKPIGVDREKRKEAAEKLSKAKKTRKLKSLIKAVYQDEIDRQDLDTEIAREIFQGFERSHDRELLFETLRFLEAKSKLLKEVEHIRGILALVDHQSEWLDSLETWQPQSHNSDRQFSSLVRHLLARYDVPLFMDRAWLQGDEIQQEWFKHVGAGKNIRTAQCLPTPLTKKEAHYFLTAPADYSIEAAFRWGQVHALGGDQRIADALLETRIIDDFVDNDFWLSVIRFLVRNPMLDTVHIGPIIDYIWHQRYENRIVFVERGVAEEIGPEQPNFSMRGRTVPSLLRQVEAWHRQLGREAKGQDLQWKRGSVGDYQSIEGTRQSKNMKIWRIRELLSSQELVAEGRQQRHCVATYAKSCYNGRCSIWTMEIETEAGVEKLVTIEVRNTDTQIRQIRGKRNRLPTEKEKDIIGRWAAEEGLEVAPYLR